MPYTTFTSDYTSSIWLRFYPSQVIKQELNLDEQLNARYSPTTDWEKVFKLGDKINQDLNLTEKNVLNEIKSFRTRKKTQKESRS